MASSPSSIENQIDSFLEQFKRSASRAMEESHRSAYSNVCGSSSISRSRSGNLDLELLEAGRAKKMDMNSSSVIENVKQIKSDVTKSSLALQSQVMKCVNSDKHVEKVEVKEEVKGISTSKKLITKIKAKKTKIYRDSNYDPTKLEDSPAQVLERFKRGCECQDDQCFKGLNPETVYKHRLNIAELTKAEHDMYLMGVTMACLTNPYETARHTERRRLRAHYVYQGRRVCLDAFLYLENCTHYQIKRIRKHLITHGVTPRVHGNHGKVPHNTFSLDIYKIATQFLKNFVETQEAKLKTKLAKNAPLHLPPDVTRKTVHDLYTQYCRKVSPDIKIMGYSTFRRFMKVQFPQVKFAKLEFVARSQTTLIHSGMQVETEQEEVPEKYSESTEIVTEDGTILPVVIAREAGQDGTYFLTQVDKTQNDISYHITTNGLLVDRTLPIAVTKVNAI